MATEANDMVIVTNANTVSLKKGTGEKTLFKLSNTVTSLGQGSFSTGLNAISIGSNGEGSGIIPFEEATEEVQGKLVVNSIRRSGTGGSAPASNYVMMYNPDTVPNEATYSSDIPQQITNLNTVLNGSTFVIGAGSSATGTNSMALGNNATTSTYNNAVAIGNGSTAGADNTFILGDGTQNVGIGTSSPNCKLEIPVNNAYDGLAISRSDVKMVLGAESSSSNNGSIQVFKNVTNTTPTSSSDTYNLSLNPYGGNIGIGTTSPEADLHIKRTGDATFLLEADSDNGPTENDNPVIELRQDGGRVRSYFGHKSGSNDITIGTSSAHIVFATKDVNSSTIDDLDVRMIVRATGNVGIGTTSPGSKLHVNGNFHFSGTNCTLRLNDSGNTTYFSYGSNGDHYLRSNSNSGKVIIQDSGGNVGIGTSSAPFLLSIGAPIYQDGFRDLVWFQSKRHAGGYIIRNIDNVHNARLDLSYLNNYGGGSYTNCLSLRHDGKVGLGTNPSYNLDVRGSGVDWAPGSWDYALMGDQHNHGTYWADQRASLFDSTKIYTNGAIVGSAVGAFSDRRIKKDIVEINDTLSLEKIRSLKPCRYKYKDFLNRTSRIVDGFIAQEVEEVIPTAINIITSTVPNIFYPGSFTYCDDLSYGIIVCDSSFNMTTDLELDNSGNIYPQLEIYDSSSNRIVVNITDIVDNHTLKVFVSNDFEFHSISEDILVYGQEVDNFYSLKKDSIFTVATAALQEVDRQLQAEKTKVADLETKNTTLEAEVATLKSQMTDLLSRVSALENP